MKTISQILLECNVDDKLADKSGNSWKVHSRYEEEIKGSKETQTVVVAIPDKDNKKDYELWSVGLETDVSMENLHKL